MKDARDRIDSFGWLLILFAFLIGQLCPPLFGLFRLAPRFGWLHLESVPGKGQKKRQKFYDRFGNIV
jgi:hypothetical protein